MIIIHVVILENNGGKPITTIDNANSHDNKPIMIL